MAVSVCSVSSENCSGVDITLEFHGERSQNCIQDYFNDKCTVTAVSINAPFWLPFEFLREGELESLLWKTGSGSFLCHDTVTFL